MPRIMPACFMVGESVPEMVGLAAVGEASSAKAGGRILIATSRFSRVSAAR